ncbi:rod shape-determining protein MreC/rod shape-determining protein MreD [Streptomyces sp. SAI-124]
MRDTRESRLLLVLLIAVAFALITVDIRGGEDSPVDGARQGAAAVFGPIEDGVSSAVDPVGNAVSAIRDSGERHDRLAALEKENAALKAKLGSDDRNTSRLKQLDKMLKIAGAGQYGIKGAQVIAIGAAQGFSWTITIDVGADDGIRRDMTVLNGDGLVGRVTTVGPNTATVLLANDPDFTVGTRMEAGDELGFASGQGDRPLRVELLNGKAEVKKGDRLVTFGSQADKPFVPGVPVGVVSRVDPSGGDLTRTLYVTPYVSFTKLDIVGVVVEGPEEGPARHGAARQTEADAHADRDGHRHPVRQCAGRRRDPARAVGAVVMRVNRILLSSALIVVALVIQVSVLARLHLPGAVPDLLLLTVLGLALVYGHVGGALVGFAAGLLADLAPPADHAAGRYALVLCVIGYLAGLAKPENGRLKSATGPMVVVVAAAIGTTLLYAGVGALVGDTAARHVGLGSLLFTAALYDLLLAPFVVPGIMALARRAENDPLAETNSAAKSADISSGWLSSGTGLKIGGQRGGLGSLKTKARTRTARVGRIKGVKRL